MDERRQFPRASGVSVTAVMLVRHNPGVTCTIVTISIGGGCLVGPLSVAPGDRVQVLFELRGSPIDVTAEVVHADFDDTLNSRVGVAFRELTLNDRESIARLVLEHPQGQG